MYLGTAVENHGYKLVRVPTGGTLAGLGAGI